MDYSTKGYHGTLADTAKSVIEENGFRVSSKKNEWLGTGVYFFAVNCKCKLDTPW